MADLTPNTTPAGERCGTCRFAGTHTSAETHDDKIVTTCLRYPPIPMARSVGYMLRDKPVASEFPHTIWDDWCGEWAARIDTEREVIGGKNTADYDRRQLQESVNLFLTHATRDAGFDYARKDIPGAMVELAPGWEYEDTTKDGDKAPSVHLTRYAPDEPL